MADRGTLGRGLAALLPGSAETILQVDVDLVAPNPDQPRKRIDPQGLQELSVSIAQHGILQPLIVSRNTTEAGALTYILIAGERRLRAARLAGIARVPVIVRETREIERLELALVENLQRADLSPLDEADAYHRLVDEFGLTQEEVGRRVGRGRVAVANSIRLLGLSLPIRTSLATGEISAGHARALLGADDEGDRLRALDAIRSRGLNVRQTEGLVRALREKSVSGAQSHARSAANIERSGIEEGLRAALATHVELQPGRRGGRIVIRYYGDDDLQEILAVLLRGRANSGRGNTDGAAS